MTEKSGTPLEAVDQLQPSVVEALRTHWITTVDELVTTAFEPKGREGLAELLNITLDELDTMAQTLLPQVSQDIRQQIGTIPRDFGLGAWDEFDTARPRDLFSDLEVPDEIPAQVSLIDHMPAVRDQGTRGTCVAHACAALREYLTGDTQINLSEQFLYWAARQRLITPILKNRPGALLVYGLKALRDHGICPEVDWPYNPNPVPGDEEQGDPPPDILKKAQTYRIERYVFLFSRDVSQLKAHLAGNHLIVFTVPTFNFWNAIAIDRAGAIRMPMLSEGILNPMAWIESAHAICMVGYQDDESVPGGGYFIIRNSWGSDWASECPDGRGFGWIPYEYLEKYGLTAFTAV